MLTLLHTLHVETSAAIVHSRYRFPILRKVLLSVGKRNENALHPHFLVFEIHCPPSSKWGPGGNTWEIKTARKGSGHPTSTRWWSRTGILSNRHSATYWSYMELTFTFTYLFRSEKLLNILFCIQDKIFEKIYSLANGETTPDLWVL